MIPTSPKAPPPPVVAYPKTLTSIAASVGGLALFLIFASVLLLSQPIGSTVRGYFYGGVDRSVGVYPVESNLPISGLNDTQRYGNGISGSMKSTESAEPDASSVGVPRKPGEYAKPDETSVGVPIKPVESAQPDEPVKPDESGIEVPEKPGESAKPGESDVNRQSKSDSRQEVATSVPSASPVSGNVSQTGSIDSGCDLYHGKWVFDSNGPLYTNNSCPVLSQMQNCQGNGRPDKEYENWRWKPAECDLPRLDAKKFLELMRGKTLAFVGDSVARNQMESMLCILWQAKMGCAKCAMALVTLHSPSYSAHEVEVPKNRGNKRMQRYYFKSTSTMIVRLWSSWLVDHTSEAIDFAPKGVDKLHLDASDWNFMELIPSFDVIVLSSGHWFAKQSVYILNNEIVGGQLWWPDKSRPMKINNVEAFGISVETIVTAMATHPNYTGLTILRSYSPDHYEGGAWNTGGSCTGKVKPLMDGELVENGFTNVMHEKQVAGFNRAIKKQTNKSKVRLMDITEAFGYRHDGHPGPYRSPDPNKITKRGPNGRPPPQDCLHWCMPGPVDIWNEIVAEIISREFQDSRSFRS
ncbi:hypothetical protein RJ640_022889 [Escallonia rubra]|uniref:Trichome birefringence-like N-terminal domain-containing protein n=1 Tax=Escallonia rubra TaxID=112253 RepID=A0AA88QYE7_9ASTE|nr:hypothetical protein RJ640_022889 [Escallonia rubra]